MLRAKVQILALIAITALSVSLAQCSGPGGTAVSTAPTPTPGPIVFTGSSIVNNVMTLPCNTNETFTVSQSGYSGTFQLTSPNANVGNGFNLSPTSGNSTVTFTVESFFGSSAVWTLTATNTLSQTGALTINFTTGQACG